MEAMEKLCKVAFFLLTRDSLSTKKSYKKNNNTDETLTIPCFSIYLQNKRKSDVVIYWSNNRFCQLYIHTTTDN